MYEILRQQLSRTNTERFPCFQTIQLTDTFQGNVELDMECNELFFWACKDTAAKFVYTFPDVREAITNLRLLDHAAAYRDFGKLVFLSRGDFEAVSAELRDRER